MGRLLFLTSDQVIFMHDALVEKWGGATGGGHRGQAYEGVEAAVQAIKNSYYTKPEELAAAYAVYIVQGHVFQDGNKRTGEAALLTFLEINDRPCRVSLWEEMVELQKRAEGGERTDLLILWLANIVAGR
jgi:death on curing protein